MEIKVSRPSKEELGKLGIDAWSPWSCDVETFDWEYSSNEDAYVFEGKVTVTTPEGESISIKTGDLVHFPKGLVCTWKIEEPIRKVYRLS